MIINLCVDGYNYWIKATGFIKQGRFYDIIFGSPEDLLYSKQYADDNKDELKIEITIAGKDGVVMNALKYYADRDEIQAVVPYTPELWDNMKEKDTYAP
tara:strand:+ start:515 stop:811 length:297 start_codon:yes stop_codon:yes gene_type:complete